MYRPLCGALIQKERALWPLPSRPYPPLALSPPSSLHVPLSPRTVSFPRVLETLEVREAPSHTLSAQSSEFYSICVSGENFSFWSVCVFPAVDSVTHWGLTRKKRLCRGCDTWTILSGNVGGQLCQQVQPAATFSDIVLQSGVLPGTAGTF